MEDSRETQATLEDLERGQAQALGPHGVSAEDVEWLREWQIEQIYILSQQLNLLGEILESLQRNDVLAASKLLETALTHAREKEPHIEGSNFSEWFDELFAWNDKLARLYKE